MTFPGHIKRIWLTGLAMLVMSLAMAQHGEIASHKDMHDLAPFSLHSDSSVKSLADLFKYAHTGGHIRNFSMATINAAELRDYFTNATGGSIHFESAQWKGLQFGVKGIFTFKTLGQDLLETDQQTGLNAKWEQELYDVSRPGEYHDLDRLEELYLKFSFGQSHISAGKIDLNEGPLLKRRDGRMKPFVYRGAWLELNPVEGHQVKAGYIDKVSPRGYSEWYDLNEAIGLGSSGQQPNGESAHYHEHSGIRAIYAFGYENTQVSRLKLQAWNYLFDRQFDLIWLQADYENGHLIAGLQYAHQETMPYQKELHYDERYVQPGEKANVFNARIGYQKSSDHKETKLSFAYLKALDTGRFLFPRELGREDFYVSQARSWIDGWGDLDVYMLTIDHSHSFPSGNKLDLEVKLSRTEAPSQANLSMNKYSLASFYQASCYPKFSFSGVLEGLDVGLLYLYKHSDDDLGLSPSDEFYHTNLHHFNLITNLYF